MHNISGNLVQERSVVGDHEDGARVSLKVIGQEGNRRNIQHVGRFCGKLVYVLLAENVKPYHQAGADQVRRTKLVPEPIAFSNHPKRSWLRSAVFLARNQDRPEYSLHETLPYPIPSLPVLNECHSG